MTPRSTLTAALAALLVAGAAPALAQVKIGATLSTTGPQASLGIPERNTISLLPTEIGGVKVEYVVLDDASEPAPRPLPVASRLERAFYLGLDRGGIVMKFVDGERIF